MPGPPVSVILAAEAVILVAVVTFLVLLVKTLLGKRSVFSPLNIVSVVFIGIIFYALFFVLPPAIDRKTNIVLEDQKQYFPEVSNKARELMKKLWIADLHSDSLLWADRDLNQRTDAGHVDIPRLLEGNVALQAFTIVTSVPLGMNMENNTEPNIISDMVTLKAFAERWGISSLSSLAARTLFQADRFHQMAKESNGAFFTIETKRDLENYIKVREKFNNVTAGFMGIEGSHALDGDFGNVDKFYQAGIRMMAPSHFFDNNIGGSAHGVDKYGLTEFGKKVFSYAQEKHILIDVAHASESVIDDVVELATLPIISSHTGFRSVCESSRNIRDKDIIGIAKTGGVIGVGYFRPTQCGDDILASIVKSILHVVDLVGAKHVALGSDYDGTVAVPFDTTGLIYIVESLLRAGISEEDIGLIMGGNVRRVLLSSLPE